MMRARRVRTIALFELYATVKRAGFIATTFLLPIALLGLSGGSVAVQGLLLAEQMSGRTTWGVVDETGALTSDRSDDSTMLVVFPTRDAAIAGLRTRDVDCLAVVPRDWLDSGRIELYAGARRSALEPPLTPPALLTRTLVSHLLEDEVTHEVRARVLDPSTTETFFVTADGIEPDRPERVLEEVLGSVIPIVFGIFFLTALLTASGYLVQAVSSDKETRFAEVMLACVTPDEVLFGKLIGLGAAGLLQLFVWVGISTGGAALAGSGLASATGLVPVAAIVLAPVLFVAGYFFLGSLMLVTGALGSNAAEAQKLSVVWSLFGVAPMLFLIAFMDAPHGAVARALTLFPTSAPLALMLRLGIDPAGVAWWEVPLALVEIALCTWFILRVGARLFAFGLLRTSLPSLRELFRVLRG